MNKKTSQTIKIFSLSSIFPIMLCFLLFWPLLSLALQSLIDASGQITFQKYLEVLTSRHYLKAFLNTANLAVGSTLLALIICIPAAIYIEGKHGRDRRVLSVALSIPLSLPGIVIGFFVIITFGFTGVVPKLLELITGERRLNFAYTYYGLLLGYLYFQIPRVILTVRGAVAGISKDVIDSAKTLGASTFQVYLYVILPTLRPAIVSAASLSLATGFGAFGTAATLSRGYRVVPLEIAAAFTENFQPKAAGAMSIILILISTTILFGISKLTERSKIGKVVKKGAPV
ncbi:MAG TPA: ABC transporter permease subunit [Clostridia bacterium]|nr:ABC transporter permease subunit [Clostridia bacterium]